VNVYKGSGVDLDSAYAYDNKIDGPESVISSSQHDLSVQNRQNNVNVNLNVNKIKKEIPSKVLSDNNRRGTKKNSKLEIYENEQESNTLNNKNDSHINK